MLRSLVLVAVVSMASLCFAQKLNPQPTPQPTPTPTPARASSVVFQADKTQVVPLEESDWVGHYPIFSLNKIIAHESFKVAEEGTYRVSLYIVPLLMQDGSGGNDLISNCIHVREQQIDGSFAFVDEIGTGWYAGLDAPSFKGLISVLVENPYTVGPILSGRYGFSYSYSTLVGINTSDNNFSSSVGHITTAPIKSFVGDLINLDITLYNPTSAKCMPAFVDTSWEYKYTFTVEKI